MYIDVHCHIETYRDIKEVVERARQAGVGIIVNNSIDFKSIRKSIALGDWFPEVKIALGVYPIETLKLDEEGVKEVIEFIRKNYEKIIAIGEVGIDLKWSENFEKQKDVFIRFVELSKELNLPLIVHSRKAEEQVIDILENKKCNRVVMHCFTGGIKLALKLFKKNFKILHL